MSNTDPKRSAEAATGDEHLIASTADRSELPPLRTYNVFAVFTDDDKARSAILALERVGIDGSAISALALTRHPAPDDPDHVRTETEEEDVALAKELFVDGAKGGTLGAVIGALGGATAAILLPGMGLAIGAGILAVATGGAVAGAGVGTFAGFVAHTPASRSWQRALVDVGDGDLVLGVHTGQQKVFDTAIEVLQKAGATSIRRVGSDGELL